MGMTREQFSVLVKGLKAVYTGERFLPDQNSFNVWYQMLSDMDYNLANIAVQKYILTNKFPPTIADIRQLAMDTAAPESAKDWSDAWEEVMSAVRWYGMYREIEALESMDEITAQAARRLGWKNICCSENITADRANFRMIYEQLHERKKANAQIPQRLREAIAAAQEKALLEAK